MRKAQFFILGAILLSILFFVGLTLSNTLTGPVTKDLTFLSENVKREFPRALNLGYLGGETGESLKNFTQFTDSGLEQNFINFTAFFVVSEPAQNDTVNLTIGNFLDSPVSVGIEIGSAGSLGFSGLGTAQDKRNENKIAFSSYSGSSPISGKTISLQARCGDGICDPLFGETCASCFADCQSECPLPICGDGQCNGGETCSTCSTDCGACPACQDSLMDSNPWSSCNPGNLSLSQACRVNFTYNDGNRFVLQPCGISDTFGLAAAYSGPIPPVPNVFFRKSNINNTCGPGRIVRVLGVEFPSCGPGWRCSITNPFDGRIVVEDLGSSPGPAVASWIVEPCPTSGGNYDVADKNNTAGSVYTQMQLPPPNNTAPNVGSIATDTTGADYVCKDFGTSDADNDAVFLHYNWLNNGNPIQALNMPFDSELDNRAYDYSGNGFTGNLIWPPSGGLAGPVWTPNGIVGGALSFDGYASFVNISAAIPVLSGNNITVEAWVNISGRCGTFRGGRCAVFAQINLSNAGYYLWVSQNRPGFSMGGVSAQSPTAIPLRQWNHIAGAANGTHLLIYVNGTLKASTPFRGTGAAMGATPVIGAERDQSYNSIFNGTIDEVIVWKRALTPEQVQLHYNKNYKTLASTMRLPGETWTCGITPIDEDGFNGTVGLTGSICGNGITEAGEQCDPPNGVTCSPSCYSMVLPIYATLLVQPGTTTTINLGPVPAQFNITINWSAESVTLTWLKDKLNMFAVYTLQRGENRITEQFAS
ncbi:MAG: LamG domain-containing protein [Candidatus Aenigmarchaeota archaeon]|nr:LamG domain-containing protein [Candidatus Aenigmarchaeota archaeon]